jgi:hypothetical protein
VPGADTFVLRIRAAYWGESYDPDEALHDVLNSYVRAGEGLSVWRYATTPEREVGAAIMVERRPDPAKGNLQVIEIAGEDLRAAGFAPVHTPTNADSSHAEAWRLHHDIEGLDNEARALALRDLLHEKGRRRDYRKDDLRPILAREVEHFTDGMTRTRIQASVDRHKPKGPG